MKNWKLLPIMAMGLCLGFASCDEDSKKEDVFVDPFANFTTPDSGTATEAELNAVVTTFVDDVVIPTYTDMKAKMHALKTAVDKVVGASTDAAGKTAVEEACDAWKAARVPWERSEAFLYGTADEQSLDPSLDSWPLDKGGIDQVLNGSGDIDQGDTEAAQSLRGFHTAEYLLFDGGEPKAFTSMTDREKQYLQKVVERMVTDTDALHTGWTATGGYGEMMKRHAPTDALGNVFSAVAQMLNGNNGMAGIANEVGTAKIGDPVNLWNSGRQDEAVLAVESWYSWNSITDYTDNIISIRNAYYGSLSGNAVTNSLCTIMKKVNPTLNDMIVKQITNTREGILDIPYPLRNNLGAATEITNAQNQCAALVTGLGLVSAKLTVK